MARILSCAAALGAALLCSATVVADDGDRLREALREASSAPSMKVKIRQSMTMEMMGQTQESSATYDISAQMPNMLAMRLTPGDQGVTVVSDGETLTCYVPSMNKYMQTEAPSTLTPLIDPSEAVQFGLTENGPLPFTFMFLDRSQSDAMMNRLGDEIRVDHVGANGGMDHYRVHLTASDYPGMTSSTEGMGVDLSRVKVPLDIWVTQGDRARIARMAPMLNDFMTEMSRQFAELMGGEQQPTPSVDLQLTFDDWAFTSSMPTATFAFTAPKDAEKVDDLMAAAFAGAEGAREAPADPGERLLGGMAPTFTVEMLDGGEFDLAKSFGREVIVLDFWATWCGPCVQALPKYIKVFDEMRRDGKNVRFIAVDLRESNEKVRSFIEKREWDTLEVAMDREGKIAEQYYVSGIPQTVVIGMDGTVQAVHVGFAPGFETTLKSEVQQLLDGTSLVK